MALVAVVGRLGVAWRSRRMVMMMMMLVRVHRAGLEVEEEAVQAVHAAMASRLASR